MSFCVKTTGNSFLAEGKSHYQDKLQFQKLLHIRESLSEEYFIPKRDKNIYKLTNQKKN